MAGKPVHVAFGGGRPTSDAGILLLVAAEQLADGILLARCALRHDPPLPVQGRRARHRDGNPHQARLLSGTLTRSGSPRSLAASQTAAVRGRRCPRRNPQRNFKPRSAASRRNRKTRSNTAVTPMPVRVMNDPGKLDAGHVQDNCASLRSFLIPTIASCVWASPTEKTRRTRKPGTKQPRTEPGCAVALDTLGAQPLCFAHYESPDARGCPWRKDIPAVLAAAPHI